MLPEFIERFEKAYQCKIEGRWEDAERLCKEVLVIDPACAEAYLHLMGIHFHVVDLCSSNICQTLKSKQEIPIDPSVPRKTWTHPEFEELAKKYVVEPYFTRDDLMKKCVSWDDENDNFTDWQIYCANEYKKIEEWWHTSKEATGAYRYSDENTRQTLDQILLDLKKTLVDDIEKEHSDMCLDMWKAFSWKIDDAHEEALQKKNAQAPVQNKKSVKESNTKKSNAKQMPKEQKSNVNVPPFVPTKALEGFKALSNQKWKEAKKAFRKELFKSPDEEAYIGAILAHMEISALNPNAVYIPTMDTLTYKPYNWKKNEWKISNFDELEKVYVANSRLTTEDLKNAFVIDCDEINQFYEYHYYLFEQMNAFKEKWHQCKYVKDIELVISEEKQKQLQEFYDAVIRKYKACIINTDNQLNRYFGNKVQNLYAEVCGHSPNTTVMPVSEQYLKGPEKLPYKLGCAKTDSKHDQKAKIVAFSISCVYVLVSLLVIPLIGRIPNIGYGISICLMAILAISLSPIYAFIKKCMFGDGHPVWAKHNLLFSISVLIVAVISTLRGILGVELVYAMETIRLYIPLWTYLLVAGKFSKKQTIALLVITFIVTNVCNLMFIGIQGFLGVILVHIIGLIAVQYFAVSSNKTGMACVFASSIATSVTLSVASFVAEEDWGYLVLNIVIFVAFLFAWSYALKDHFGWANFIFKAKVNSYRYRTRNGNSWSYDYGSGSNSDIMGDIAASQQQSRDASAAAAQADQDSRNEADEAYAQSYGFDSKQDAEDHGFM